jgi:two-component system nitrate/nitrite sensor histidine kinase NarX
MSMKNRTQWSLGTKLALIGAPFLLLALLSTAATLWVSWQLDGGAAAVNEAGRMRMQSYRMALSIGIAQTELLPQQVKEFDQSLALLRHGDPVRPLFVPWDAAVQARFEAIESSWAQYRLRWIESTPNTLTDLRSDTVKFASQIDGLVTSIEAHLALWTAILHLLQLALLAMAVLSAAVLLFTGYLFVLEPVNQLKLAIDRIQLGDFGARVERLTSDEFGDLADGFNGMADHLQSMYRNLEHKVLEKTAMLEEKHERLESLYEVTGLVARATTLDELAQGFVKSITRIAHADGAALRWSDQSNKRYLMLSALGLPSEMVSAEQCIQHGDCDCGVTQAEAGLRVIPIQAISTSSLQHCKKAGFETVINIPVRLHERLMGEVSLFFHARVNPPPALVSLLEALCSQLASAIDNLRLNALEREAAVSQERHMLARELHDSIAQSLAFLKIQVQLMRDAVRSADPVEIDKVLDEIDTGVRESYGDVRELLLHFRTRTNDEDIEPALATTLRKFEHQSGLQTSMKMQGHGMPLLPDLQIQVLHIVQEALSNVRKHAGASHVWLDVQQQPFWRFEVRDDGVGFKVNDEQINETHVGIRIMTERAQRIGGAMHITSTPGVGTTVVLSLPQATKPMPVTSTDLHADNTIEVKAA